MNTLHSLTAFIAIIFLLGGCSQPTETIETSNPPSLKESPSTQEAQETLPIQPFQRIQAIVEKNGVEAEIFDRNSNMTAENATPPFDVMVIASANNCSAAKLLAWNITRDLYTDNIVAPTIERVKVMVTSYISTSLGSDFVSKMSEDMWNVGSSIFFEAAQSESSQEILSGEGLPLSRITFGVTDRGCEE